jgi:hypothetical protein
VLLEHSFDIDWDVEILGQTIRQPQLRVAFVRTIYSRTTWGKAIFDLSRFVEVNGLRHASH